MSHIKCELCKSRESVIHVQQIIGEEKVDMHLCEVCAAEKGIAQEADDGELSLSQLLTGLLNIDSTQESESDTCPSCGTSIRSFRKEGRLGCPGCYANFSKELRSVQKKLAGTYRHAGKLPQKLKAYKELVIDKKEMQQRLEEAVKNEDYESAAALRDQIREIEKQSGIGE